MSIPAIVTICVFIFFVLFTDFVGKNIEYNDDKKKLFYDPMDAFIYWIPFGRLILTIKTDARELNKKMDEMENKK